MESQSLEATLGEIKFRRCPGCLSQFRTIEGGLFLLPLAKLRELHPELGPAPRRA